MTAKQSTPYAGLPARILAGTYDLLPVAALWFGVAMIAVALNGGEAVTGAARIVLLFAALAVTVAYLAVSLRRGGQTLGMRAWRLRMVAADGTALGWLTALQRALCGVLQLLPFGLGLLAAAFDREHRSVADRICATRVLRLPRTARPENV